MIVCGIYARVTFEEKMSIFAYDLTDTELLDRFAQACAESGTANAKLIYRVIGPSLTEDIKYLKGVLHARLAGQKPPVHPGDIVRFKKQPEFFGYELRGDKVQTFIVEQVLYVGHDPYLASKKEKWHITLRNVKAPSPFTSFHWEEFEKVASDPTMATTQPA